MKLQANETDETILPTYAGLSQQRSGAAPVASRGRALNRLRRATLLAAAAMLLGAGAASADETGSEADIAIEASRPGDSAPAAPAPLWELRDAKLQRELEGAMKRLGLGAALSRGVLSVALVDVTDRENPRVSSINGDQMFYAASLPKIIVLLAVFEKVESGELTIDDEIHGQIDRMTRISSNSDSTALMQKVGKPFIADLVRSPRYLLYDPARNGGLWAGKDYAGGGLWRRDPLHNLSHGATAMQVARFYYMLDTGQLVSPSASREMKRYLNRKKSGQKFMKGLRQAQPDATIYRKGGTWRNFHADGALVQRPDGAAYIAVALTKSAKGREWFTQIAITMDELIEAPSR